MFEKILGPKLANVLYRLIIETAWPFRFHYVVALILMSITSGMFAATALMMKDIFNEVFISQNIETLKIISLVILIIFTVRGISMYGQNIILARVNNRIVADLQKRLFEHVLSQGQQFHETRSSGEVTVRAVGNVGQASAVLQTIATRLGMDLLTVVGMIAVMFWNDVVLALLALFGLPAIFGGVAYLIQQVKGLARDQVFLGMRILTIATEASMGSRVIRAFNLQKAVHKRAADIIETVREKSDRLAILGSLSNPLMEVVAGIGAATVLLFAGWRIIEGQMEIGTLVSFLFALFAMGDPARRLAQIFVSLRQSLVGVEIIYETLDTDERVPEVPNASDLNVTTGEVVLDSVTFAYSEAPVLKSLSFTAKGGQLTALVGPSGGGKSTTLALIERFFDPISGRILVDGQDTCKVGLQSLRSNMALVTQDTFLFDDSVAENIRFGREDATQAEIEDAAKAANAHEFIMEMPLGYKSQVGEGGTSLSGGQRQRIAIARAVLRDAPILLLDEATSALDAESEARVQEALHRLMSGRTTIVIAHRLATIKRAQSIVVISDGQAIEQGSHNELVKRGGTYSKLAELQFQGT